MYKRQGYSMVLEEEEITESSLLEAIRKLYQERNKYIAAMSAGKNLNSIQHIVNLIEECIHSWFYTAYLCYLTEVCSVILRFFQS